ncbi:MAG: tetratricopeptide repeat protein [Candidatus Methylomirabilia bacterium]
MIRTRGGTRTAIGCALLLLLVAAIYRPVPGFGFVTLDDGIYVYENPHVLGGLTPANIVWSFTTLHAGFWMPLTWLSLMADASLWGGWAGGYHLTNVGLHASAAILFFLLLRHLLGVSGIPLLAAALFAAHPLHVESVAWVTERKDVLSQALFLLFLHAWLRHLRRPSPRRHAGALLVFALSLMVKPMGFTTPGLLLVLDWWPLGRLNATAGRQVLRLVLEKIPATILALGIGVVTLVGQSRTGAMTSLDAHPLSRRLGNAVVTVAQNLGRTIWPAGLGPFYPGPPGGLFPPVAIAAAALLLAALLFVAFILRRRQPWIAAGLAWFLVGFVPLHLIIGGLQVTADRFTYLPLLGIHLLLACIAFRAAAVARHPGRAAALLLLPGLLAIPAHRQANFWRNGETLLRRALAVSRDTGFVRNNLGVALVEAGRPVEATVQYEAALRLEPDNVLAHHNLGAVLGAMGQVEEGIGHAERAVALEPGNAALRVTLGTLLLKTGRLADAEQVLQAALKTDVESSVTIGGMAALRLEQGRLQDARDLAATATVRNPFDPRAWYLLGTATARLGDPAGGEISLRRALTLQPGNSDAGYNLALAILNQGRTDEARALLGELHLRHPEDEGIDTLRKQVDDQTRTPEPTP